MRGFPSPASRRRPHEACALLRTRLRTPNRTYHSGNPQLKVVSQNDSGANRSRTPFVAPVAALRRIRHHLPGISRPTATPNLVERRLRSPRLCTLPGLFNGWRHKSREKLGLCRGLCDRLTPVDVALSPPPPAEVGARAAAGAAYQHVSKVQLCKKAHCGYAVLAELDATDVLSGRNAPGSHDMPGKTGGGGRRAVPDRRPRSRDPAPAARPPPTAGNGLHASRDRTRRLLSTITLRSLREFGVRRQVRVNAQASCGPRLLAGTESRARTSAPVSRQPAWAPVSHRIRPAREPAPAAAPRPGTTPARFFFEGNPSAWVSHLGRQPLLSRSAPGTGSGDPGHRGPAPASYLGGRPRPPAPPGSPRPRSSSGTPDRLPPAPIRRRRPGSARAA